MYAEKVRHILAKRGRLATPVDQFQDDTDLYNAGLTSLATVALMLELEDQFEIEFPDHMLGRKTFGSIASIVEAIELLRRK